MQWFDIRRQNEELNTHTWENLQNHWRYVPDIDLINGSTVRKEAEEQVVIDVLQSESPELSPSFKRQRIHHTRLATLQRPRIPGLTKASQAKIFKMRVPKHKDIREIATLQAFELSIYNLYWLTDEANLEHSKAATAVITSRFNSEGLKVTLVQETWINRDQIRGLKNTGKNFIYKTASDLDVPNSRKKKKSRYHSRVLGAGVNRNGTGWQRSRKDDNSIYK